MTGLARHSRPASAGWSATNIATCLIPARKAARTDPLDALRVELARNPLRTAMAAEGSSLMTMSASGVRESVFAARRWSATEVACT